MLAIKLEKLEHDHAKLLKNERKYKELFKM